MTSVSSALCRAVVFFALMFSATLLKANETSAPDLGVDISFRYQTQQYNDSDASLFSTTLSSYLMYDNWVFGLDLPYQRVNGVFNFRGTAQQERNCALLAEGASLPPKLEPYRDRLLARCNVLTQDNNTEEGVGDLNAYASYGKSLNDESWYVMWSMGYDGDNADEQRQLGSGTRDLYMDLVLTKDEPRYSLLFLAGYNYLMGGVYQDLYDNYSYLGAEISSPRREDWVIGVGLDYQHDTTEPIGSARLFGQWRAKESLMFKVQVKGYDDSIYYPNSSVDASLLLSF